MTGDDFPPLDMGMPALFDATFEIESATPNIKSSPIVPPRRSSTIFVRIKNEAQFEKAKSVIANALYKAKIDHNI